VARRAAEAVRKALGVPAVSIEDVEQVGGVLTGDSQGGPSGRFGHGSQTKRRRGVEGTEGRQKGADSARRLFRRLQDEEREEMSGGVLW
jgi:hypothetical protein